MSDPSLRYRQRGVTLATQLTVAIVAVLVAMLVMRVAPALVEYFNVQKHVKAIARDATAHGDTVEAIRIAFNKQANVDDIQSVTGSDLDISKEGGEVVIAFSYSRKIPLFGPVSLCFDFQGATTPSGGK